MKSTGPASSARKHAKSSLKYSAPSSDRVWLLLGPELGKKKQALGAIKKTIADNVARQGGVPGDVHKATFFLGSDDSADVVEEITGASLFAQFKIIIVEQIDSAPAAVCSNIARALRHVVDTVYVVLIGDGTKVAASLDARIPKANKKIFWQLSETDYTRYVLDRARTLQLELHPDAIDAIVHLAGEHTHELDMILASIRQYVQAIDNHEPGADAYASERGGNKRFIERETIEQWIAHYRPESVFSLFAMLALHRYAEAADIFAALISSGENPVYITAGLLYVLKNAAHIKQEQETGKPLSAIFTALNIRSYTTQNQYKDFLSNLSVGSVRRMVRLCVDTDIALRDGYETRYHAVLISKMLYDIICLMRGIPHGP